MSNFEENGQEEIMSDSISEYASENLESASDSESNEDHPKELSGDLESLVNGQPITRSQELLLEIS